MANATALLQDYLTAFERKDIERIETLSADHCLVEIPFLKPNRLVGKTEILKGLSEIFATLESIEFKLDNIEANDNQVIAEGVLKVARTGEDRQGYQLGLVAEAKSGLLQRVSLYCDARNVRPWSDKSIL